jgi:hypothetical protein
MIIGKAISPFALRKKGSVPTDADAQAFITATGITGTNATATNQLVVDLKAANIWTKMKAVYPLVGGTATSHKFNLLNPVDSNAAFRLVFAGGLTHSSNGILGGGVNGWANTFLIPSTSLTLNNNHVSANITSDFIGAGTQVHISSNQTASAINQISSLSNVSLASYNGSSTATVTKTVTSTTHKGFWCGSRTANNVHNLIDPTGTITSNTTTVTSTLPTLSVGLLCRRAASTDQYSGFGYSFFSIGNGLTTTELTAFKTAVNNFQTTLGRL